jgi:hypothetical protein
MAWPHECATGLSRAVDIRRQRGRVPAAFLKFRLILLGALRCQLLHQCYWHACPLYKVIVTVCMHAANSAVKRYCPTWSCYCPFSRHRSFSPLLTPAESRVHGVMNLVDLQPSALQRGPPSFRLGSVKGLGFLHSYQAPHVPVREALNAVVDNLQARVLQPQEVSFSSTLHQSGRACMHVHECVQRVSCR